ncbi:type II toxin-antitoxin system YafQ family toxin [Treponema pectinovorum]|uniref:type II toxin-antitoxin system YafQ family toxin n=1 Tax=Treponema pectinovorum TaxID=164 RepID=UPI0011CC57CA|nr:type II toxin-antitoxin system YafQ family toxin [Treponema pectinovorum]
MKRELHITKSFKTDIKKLNKKEIQDTRNIVLKLQNDEILEKRFKDHALHGNYEGFRECHVHPDLLLVYKKAETNDIYILSLLRINPHANIFDM